MEPPDNNIIPTAKLLKITDLSIEQKESLFIPFWGNKSDRISEKLWLPTNSGFVNSRLIHANEFPGRKRPRGVASWFSIKQRIPLKRIRPQPYNQSSLSFPNDVPANLSDEFLKTLKIRIFPTQKEVEKLLPMFDQQRWYYNAMLEITYDHYFKNGKFTKNKYSYEALRDLMRKHTYFDERNDYNDLVFRGFDFNEETSQIPIPEWWDRKDIHSRVPRGAVAKFTSSLNSALSNFKNGNIKKFKMDFRTKKAPLQMLHFEDKGFPSWIRKIKSKYWFTSKEGKKTFISYSDIGSQKGLEVIHEKETNKFYFHVPIARDWFPKEDRRNENQVNPVGPKRNRVIALDPGIRKFLTGYDPEGKCFFLGEGAHRKIVSTFKKIDKLQSENDTKDSPSISSELRSDEMKYGFTTHISSFNLWQRMKNLVSELHWKCASFLVKNYDAILLPDFRVQQMVIKTKSGVRLGRLTKRLMNMFSFYKFKVKLAYKCKEYGKKLLIVDESFTSCTCGNCGNITRLKGKEVYNCGRCNLEIDRDINGARNILIKNSTLR